MLVESEQDPLWQSDLPRVLRPLDSDPELEKVVAHYEELDPDGSRTAAAIRRTFDMLLDGQHTGRYRWEQLHKTEKTHAGTLIEINLQREFNFDDGDKLDYKIAGVDVDCKYSQRAGGWMVPPEAVGKLLLVVTANDFKATWSAGVVRASRDRLSEGDGNRDLKRYLNKAGRAAITWMFLDASLPENVLLYLTPEDAAAIFDPAKKGQARIVELCVRVQRRIISRNVVATVAQQDDYMKRMRGNGGARTKLKPRGFVILGQYERHREVARQLRIPVPGRGDSVSVRLIRRPEGDHRPYIVAEGTEWVVAAPGEREAPGPDIPST